MVSRQLAFKIDEFLSTVNGESYLVVALSKLAAEDDKVLAAAMTTVNNDDIHTVHGLNRQSRAILDKAHSISRTIDPFELSREIDKFQEAHAKLAASMSLGMDRDSHYSKLVANYKTAFTAVFRQATYVNIPQLLQAAALLYSNIIGDREMLRLISAELQGNNINGDLDGFARLTLHFHSKQTLEEIAQKLTALLGIYAEICELINVSPSQFPLTPQKIETGSFWTDLLGYPKAMQLMEKYTDACLGFLHRTYTREGKLAQLPRTVDQMDALLGLRTSLNEQGINIADLDANIEKAAVKLSKQFYDLLGSEPSVEVNGKSYRVSADLQSHMLERRKTKLLPRGGNETETEQP